MGLFRKQSHNSSAFWLDGVTPPLIQWKQSRCLSAPRLLCFISLLCSCGKDDRFPAVLLQLLRRSPLMIASPHWQWMATGMLIMGPKGGSQGPRHLLLTSFFIHLSGRKFRYLQLLHSVTCCLWLTRKASSSGASSALFSRYKTLTKLFLKIYSLTCLGSHGHSIIFRSTSSTVIKMRGSMFLNSLVGCNRKRKRFFSSLCMASTEKIVV